MCVKVGIDIIAHPFRLRWKLSLSFSVCSLLSSIPFHSLVFVHTYVYYVRLQLAVPLVQYERRIGRAGCCGGFVAQWL